MKNLNERLAIINEVINEISIEDFSKYHLNNDELLNTEDFCPVSFIHRNIARKNNPSCYFIAGQKGSGKTSYLLKLKQTLEDDKYFVIYCDIAKDINIFDLHYVDFMMAVLKNITDNLQQKDLFLNYTTLGKVHLNEIKDLIPFKSLDFHLKFSMISDYIKFSDYLREKVRYVFDSQAILFINSFKNIINQARKIIQDFGMKDIVIIIDGLDKVNSFNKKDENNLIKLFTIHSNLIKELSTEMILSLPIELYFNEYKADFEKAWKEPISIIPIYSVKNETTKQFYYQILDKRFDIINHKLDLIADNKTIKQITSLSGGNIGQFISLFSHCLNYCDNLPIEEKTINTTKTIYKQNLLSSLSLEELEYINNFSPKHFNSGSLIGQKLLSLNIIMYSTNSNSFYINPII